MENDYLISKNEFAKLSRIHDQHCVSIYVPTDRAGKEVDNKKGQITLKNCLKEVKSKLKDYQLKDTEIEDYLSPAEDLLEDHHFWRNQSDCLVILLDKNKMMTYTLPINQPQFTYVADHFYLLPILPIFSYNGRFYLLNLSLNKVKFYETSRYSIEEVVVKGIVPEQLEEVVGYDYEKNHLQFRSGQGGEAGAIFHGQGSGKDHKAIETEKFFRAVDQSLKNIIKDDKTPLVLACVDHYYSLFKKITSHPKLYHKHINGNHEDTSPLLLHEMALEIVDDYFQKGRKSATVKLKEQSSVGKFSSDLNDIIPAALEGRIESLFIQKSNDRYGLYDIINRSLIIDEGHKAKQASLFNMAAIQTWLKDGNVFIVEKDKMPFNGTSINALFRY
ncbi:MAG: hypothetical protein C0595_11960 [Marinilabiliales bacterium]|nr:MAG: hypothetical protein C0595_11960 [Marinilabiliales bacterium]